MLPDPIHPAIVHLPIALAVLMPGFAILGALAIHRGWVPARTWIAVVMLQALLVASGWMALETGEDQEDRVERVVAERHIESHEEAAERFLLLSGLVLVATGAGLLPDRAGAAARTIATLGTLGVVVAVGFVGHSGGELVYKHGAAAAYTQAAGKSPATLSKRDYRD